MTQLPAAPPRPLALVTGASSGIGAAFARELAARGHDLALVARREDRLMALADELSAAHGVECRVIPADLSRPGAEQAVLEAARQGGRRVSVLVNAAGYSIPQSFADVPWAAQRDFLMTLVVSACGLAWGAVRDMVELGEGRIINVASLAGFSPGVAGHSLYPGAKSLSIKLSQALDAEYRARGVRVTATCPGFTQTEFAQANGTDEIMAETPRLLFLTPEQVVAATMRANDRGKVVVCPGWHSALAAGLMQYLPQGLVRWAIMKGSARYHLSPEEPA